MIFWCAGNWISLYSGTSLIVVLVYQSTLLLFPQWRYMSALIPYAWYWVMCICFWCWVLGMRKVILVWIFDCLGVLVCVGNRLNYSSASNMLMWGHNNCRQLVPALLFALLSSICGWKTNNTLMGLTYFSWWIHSCKHNFSGFISFMLHVYVAHVCLHVRVSDFLNLHSLRTHWHV